MSQVTHWSYLVGSEKLCTLNHIKIWHSICTLMYYSLIYISIHTYICIVCVYIFIYINMCIFIYTHTAWCRYWGRVIYTAMQIFFFIIIYITLKHVTISVQVWKPECSVADFLMETVGQSRQCVKNRVLCCFPGFACIAQAPALLRS